MTPQSLKLISVNIEGHKHLDLVLPFLRSNNPDVVCLQEVYEPDFQMLCEALGMKGHFTPMTLIQLDKKTGPRIPWGIGLLTHLPFTDMRERYYYGDRATIPENNDNFDTIYKALVSCIAQKDGVDYTIGTSHFTWTPNGEANENQRRDMPMFLSAITERPEMVFCGDFNAPRGREMFAVIAERYKDNIPASYDSSIDENLHRVRPKLRYMVDCLFSTPQYLASNVRLVSGVSDHCAIVADISKA
ncbi:MAG: endonuclease/exonuclease/phosphatase family protein [bacterium]|nr:endonuclease/exonuclease/phosphatase family protein [bacterium]